MVKAQVSMQREYEETPFPSDLSILSVQKYRTLTASVFESVDGVGQEADTAQKTCTLLFVDLLMVPYTDGD